MRRIGELLITLALFIAFTAGGIVNSGIARAAEEPSASGDDATTVDAPKAPVAAQAAQAEQSLPPGVKTLRFAGGRVELEAENADLVELLQSLSKASGVEIEVYDGVNGKVSAKLADALVKNVVIHLLREAKQENWATEYQTSEEGQEHISKITVLKKSKEWIKSRVDAKAEAIKSADLRYEQEFQDFYREMNSRENKVFEALEKIVAPDTSDRKRRKLKAYLDTVTPSPEEKEVLKKALFIPKYAPVRNTITLALLHAMQGYPEMEKDREYLVEVFNDPRIGPAWLLYAAVDNWDDRYYEPLVDRYLSINPPSWSVIDLLREAGVKEAKPILEEVLYHPDRSARRSAGNALLKFAVGDPAEEERIRRIMMEQGSYYAEKERQRLEAVNKRFEEARKREAELQQQMGKQGKGAMETDGGKAK